MNTCTLCGETFDLSGPLHVCAKAGPYADTVRGPKPCEINLSSAERLALSGLVGRSGGRHRQRALIVLYAADGIPNRQIATLVGLNQNQVGMWRKRYATFGLAGLVDLPRSGRPRVHIDGSEAHDA